MISDYLWLLLPILIVIYIIAQILWSIRSNRKHRDLAKGAEASLIQRMRKHPFATPETDFFIEWADKELKRLKNIK